jgi:hypothetical protein
VRTSARSRAVLPVLAAAAACAQALQPATLAAPANAPPEVVTACELATDRCARCHPLSRVQQAHVEGPRHWVWYVSRMRLQPRSGIAESEEATIVRCLVARSFGLQAAAAEIPR